MVERRTNPIKVHKRMTRVAVSPGIRLPPEASEAAGALPAEIRTEENEVGTAIGTDLSGQFIRIDKRIPNRPRTSVETEVAGRPCNDPGHLEAQSNVIVSARRDCRFAAERRGLSKSQDNFVSGL